MDLLLPAVTLAMGLVFTLRPPRRINALYGYRSRRSMASQAAWDEAHRFSGHIYIRVGAALMVLALLVRLFVPLPPEIVSLALCVLSLAAIIVPIPFVERRLKAISRSDASKSYISL